MKLRHNYRGRPSRRNTGTRKAWSPFDLAPELWFDASSLTSGATTWTNQGTGGSVLNGTFGATTAAPRVLTHTGTNYLYLPGGTISANFAAAPNSGTSLGGDVSIAVRYDPTDRTLDAPLLLKRQSGVDSNLAPFNFGQWIVAGGSLKLSWTDTSGGSHTLYASTSVPAAAKWVGVQHDIDNGTGGNTAHFYWSSDATNPTWTLLESVTEAFVDPAGRRVNAAQIGVGGTDVGQHGAVGKYYEAKVWSGLTFTNAPLFHADFTTGITSGAQTGIFDSSSNNAAITINRSASGYKATAVVRPTLLFGGGQYVDVADNALLNFDASTSQTVIAVTRQWGTPVSFGRIVDKKNGGGIGLGWSLSNVATTIQPGLYLGDGTNQSSATGSAGSSGALAVYTGVVDRTSNIETAYLNPTAGTGTSTTTIATLVNALPLRVGAAANALGSYHEGEINAVLVFRRALTAAEIQQVCDYYTYEGALAYTVGTLTTSAGYNVLTFNGSGTFTPGRNLPVEYLVVAGGGGGGGTTGAGNGAGGGGAGGLLTNVGATKLVLPKGQQTVTIGAGGAGTTGSGTNGSASSIGTLLVANGGGRGGGWTLTGLSGGSGGGSGPVASPNPTVAAGSGTAGQGFDGGAGNSGTGSFRHGGGGGGAGGAGGAGTTSVGGAGGASVNNAISGTVTAYAGGGGGGGTVAGGAAGGGGSTAGTVGVSATAATANTGGGGGGTGSNTATAYTGGAGGSGIVIIRWPA